MLTQIVGLLVAASLIQSTPATVTGNVERGKTLYTVAYKCGSCHGTTGTSGNPRLVPMGRDQANFITFLQKPAANAMPAYGDQPVQNLADVYAYIKSIPAPTTPPAQNIPILNDILKTIQ
jgi:mono/diheme cytochrome c family protein